MIVAMPILFGVGAFCVRCMGALAWPGAGVNEMITPKLTFYQLGNADTIRVDFRDERVMLVDFADVRNRADPLDRRADLPAELRRHMAASGQKKFAVAAFTHLDRDHTIGSSEFFHWDSYKAYQGPERYPVDELWVPAAALTEVGLDDCARVIRQEARHRLLNNYGVRVFSRPEALAELLASHNLTVADRRHLITDAGETVPGYGKYGTEGVEFFAHSPFAWRRDDRGLEDRNQDCLVFRATFLEGGRETRVLFASDAPWAALEKIVQSSRRHLNLDKLDWDVMKVSHHSSYLSLNSDRSNEETVPLPDIKWLFEEAGQRGGIIVSTSDPIPARGGAEDGVQPPHRQAAAYYRRVRSLLDGEYVVTMERPSRSRPKPTEILIQGSGARLVSASTAPAVAVTSQPVRAG